MNRKKRKRERKLLLLLLIIWKKKTERKTIKQKIRRDYSSHEKEKRYGEETEDIRTTLYVRWNDVKTLNGDVTRERKKMRRREPFLRQKLPLGKLGVVGY